MAVAVDAVGTDNGTTTSTHVSSLNYTGITVGTGANRALVFVCAINGGTPPTGVTAVWDNGGAAQSMTQLISFADPSNGDLMFAFGLRNPVSGNKTLRLTWTNANNIWGSAISFTGVDQTSDVAAFQTNSINSGINPTDLTISISSDTNSYCVGGFETLGGMSSDTDTRFADSANGWLDFSNFTAQYGAGASPTKTMGDHIAGGTSAAIIVNVSPAAAAAGSTPYNPWPQMAPIMAQ